MAVKSSKNTTAASHFRASLVRWVEESSKKKNELAAELGLSPSNFGDYLHGVKSPSLAVMEEIAMAIGLDLADMLQEGRSILTGTPIPTEKALIAPPAVVQPPATISPEREMELLRKMEALTDDLRASAARRDYLADELHKKDARIKEKDKIIDGKNEIIKQLSEANGKLIDILKEAGEEDRLPPELIFSALMSLAEVRIPEK